MDGNEELKKINQGKHLCTKLLDLETGKQEDTTKIEDRQIMTKFKPKDEELFLKIASDVISSPEKYMEAGKWLDQYYDNGLCTEKQNEVKQQKHQLLEEIKEIEGEIKTEKLNENSVLNDKLSELEGELFTKNQRLEFLSQFETKQRPLIKERLAYALEDLFKDYQHAGVLSELDARSVLLIVWIATDAKTNEMQPSITKFANVPWKTKAEVSDKIRFGLASFLFLDLDIALHYEYIYKPNGGLFNGPLYELHTNYLQMIHRSWAKIKAEKETVQKPAGTEQKIMPEKYIKLAEQIASNLEDWANPKDETGLRYEYVGHLKPISIALEGFNEILNWLHLNRAEEGKYVQAAYDELISKAKVDDALLEKLYDGDEVFSEQCAIDLANALRLVAKTAGYVFVGKPIALLSEDEFIQGTGDEWITVGVAAKLLGVNPGVVSRWATESKIKDNRETGRKRRVLKSSVLLMKNKREHEDLLSDATEDLQNRANKIPDRH